MNGFINWYLILGLGVFLLMLYGVNLGKQVAQGRRKKDALYWIVLTLMWLSVIAIVIRFILNLSKT